MLMMFRLECTRTMKAGEYRTQGCKPWECIQHCGKQITGQPGVGLRRLIGVRHHSMHITRTLTLKGAQYRDQLTVPLTQVIGGRGQLTRPLMPLKHEGIGGFVSTTWSMITVMTSRATQWPHRSALPAFKPEIHDDQFNKPSTCHRIDTTLFYTVSCYKKCIFIRSVGLIQFIPCGSGLFYIYDLKSLLKRRVISY